MKPLPFVTLATLTALLAQALTATPATAGFACPPPSKPAFKTACDDAELVRLDKAVDAALSRALAAADPLTALLLKRDQRWFVDTLGNVDTLGIESADGRERTRVADALTRRLAALERTRSPAGSLAGSWTNTFNDVTVESAGDTLRVAIAPRAVYASADDVAGCSAKAEIKRDDDGWFTGAAINTTEGDAPADNNPFKLRLRLQGKTLRVVLTHDEQDSFCARPEQITGRISQRSQSARRRPTEKPRPPRRSSRRSTARPRRTSTRRRSAPIRRSRRPTPTSRAPMATR